jgi:hypothetical protein
MSLLRQAWGKLNLILDKKKSEGWVFYKWY